MLERVPLVVIEDSDGDKYAYRLGQDMYLWESYGAEEKSYVQINIVGNVKDLLIGFDLPLFAVVDLVEKAELEAIGRMAKKNAE